MFSDICYQRRIANHDPKPENILLDSELNTKVTDSGFSAEFSDHELNTFCGTMSYMALEILQIQPHDGPKVDVWSLGIILYRMVTGKLPFVGDNLGNCSSIY